MQQSNTQDDSNKKQEDIIKWYYSLVTKLLNAEDYKGLEDPILKIHPIDPKGPCIEQLLSAIILDQNRGKSILSTSERYSQDYSKVAKKLGLKKVQKKHGGENPQSRNKNKRKNDFGFMLMQEEYIKRKNSDYQDLLIKMLELKPELRKRVMEINNFSSNYCMPLLANAYNYYSQTKDINGVIKKLKNSIEKEGYNISAGISLAQLYENKERYSKNKPKSEKEWNEIIELLLNDQEANFDSIKHCALGNKIKKYVHTQQYASLDGYNGFTLIFKIGQKGAGLKREKEAIERLKMLNRQNKLNIHLPTVKCFIQKEDLEYLIMESSGKNVLEDVIASDPYQILTEIIDHIANIHKHFPTDLLEKTHSQQKEENKKRYSETIKHKLFENLTMSLVKKCEYSNKTHSRLIDLNEYDVSTLKKGYEYMKYDYSLYKKDFNSKEHGKEIIITYSPKAYVDNEDLRFDTTLEQKFFENYEVILNIISSLKEGVYKDASLKNWVRVYKSDENIHASVSIDYGTLRNSPYQFDIANAIESIPYEIPSYRDMVLRYYHTTLADTKDLGNFEDFKKGYHACAVHKCLINIGNSLRFFLEDTDKHKNYILDIKEQSENLLKSCKTLLNNAQWNINELKDYYSNSSEEHNQLTGLDKQLKRVKDYIQGIAR